MRKILIATASIAMGMIASSCSKETHHKDRSNAIEMYERICKLTKEYTEKIVDSSDSMSWAAINSEFESKLDKVNFSYPPDTDLLITEGQNDTIYSLMQAYIKARDGRIHSLLHPIVVTDTLTDADEVMKITSAAEVSPADASHSPGN